MNVFIVSIPNEQVKKRRNIFLILNRVGIRRTGQHTPNKNSQEYSPGSFQTLSRLYYTLTDSISGCQRVIGAPFLSTRLTSPGSPRIKLVAPLLFSQLSFQSNQNQNNTYKSGLINT